MSSHKTTHFYFSQPKPVFNSVNRKFSHQRYQQEEITPQHEELVNYVFECKNIIFINNHFQINSSQNLYEGTTCSSKLASHFKLEACLSLSLRSDQRFWCFSMSSDKTMQASFATLEGKYLKSLIFTYNVIAYYLGC